MNRLDGKVALLSGAARGIGAETARLMIEAGAKVAIGDVLDERGRETVRMLESAGGEAIYTHLDVTRDEDWTASLSAAIGRFGGLDILVNNAGVGGFAAIDAANYDAIWDRSVAVMLTPLPVWITAELLLESTWMEPWSIVSVALPVNFSAPEADESSTRMAGTIAAASRPR